MMIKFSHDTMFGFALATTTAAFSLLPGTVNAVMSTGLIRSQASFKCWQTDTINFDEEDRGHVTEGHTHFRPTVCDMNEPLQQFEYDDTSHILKVKNHNKCIDGNTEYDHLFLWTCGLNAPNHHWRFVDGDDGYPLANGILKSGQDVCASTDTHRNTNQITWARCDQVQEHFQFVKIELDTKTGEFVSAEGGGATLPTVPPALVTTAGTGQTVATAPPLSASSSGDPHFKTWSGHKFDFHGGCDLVLLKNPSFANGLGLNIHIRTKITTWWSSIEAVVVQIGDQMFELKGGQDGEGPNYWVNGLKGDEEAVANDDKLIMFVNQLKQHFKGFQTTYKRIDSKHHRFRIDFDTGDAISLDTYKRFVSVQVKVDPSAGNLDNATVGGMMGAYPSGDMLARDGKTNLNDDPVAFGKEWQVQQHETMLFHSAEAPQHPAQCMMPQTQSLEERQKQQRRLGESLITPEKAEEKCAGVDTEDFDDCVFDVLATNDMDMAGAY